MDLIFRLIDYGPLEKFFEWLGQPVEAHKSWPAIIFKLAVWAAIIWALLQLPPVGPDFWY